MEILPAIDIKDGRVVRLYQGNYAQVTTFPDSVVEAGRRWAAEGARWLHVVDLDGARAGHPVNTVLILALRQAVDIRIEAGGGLRTAAHVDELLDAGIDRVSVGTAALRDPALLAHALARGAEAVCVAVDAREGRVATDGWLETSAEPAADYVRRLAAAGVRYFAHTDIARDGAMAGPNYAALREVRAALDSASGAGPRPLLIAAGGVSSLEHVAALRMMGLDGAIIGRALYTGATRLVDALAAAQGEEAQRDG